MTEHLRRIFERRSWRAAAPVTVLLGTSRADGNTRRLVDAVFPRAGPARIVDLATLRIAPYDYAHRHETDDFLSVARAMAASDAVVFASPVYWYAMSAQMKTFIDRMSDLTETHKPLGRALKGKAAFALATSGGAGLPAHFEAPFADTARYFAMDWGGLHHAHFREPRALTAQMEADAARFADRIGKALMARAA